MTFWSESVSDCVMSDIVSVAVSSLLIVPDDTSPVVMAASCTADVPVTSPSVMENVSLSSTMSSPTIVTTTFCVSPAVPVKDALVPATETSVPSAVPSADAYATVRPPSTSALSVITALTFWSESVSDCVMSDIVSVAVSSLVMVAVAVLTVPALAPLSKLVSDRAITSLSSTMASAAIVTEKFCDVSPAAKLTVMVSCVKSDVSAAVAPLATPTTTSTVVATSANPVRDTVPVIVPAPSAALKFEAENSSSCCALDSTTSLPSPPT